MNDKQRMMEECLAYFKGRDIFCRLFQKVRAKYESLGHFGGSVTLTNLKNEDTQQLGGFFQKDYYGKKSATISYEFMEKALSKSKFSALTWEEILQGYFRESLEGKRERQQREQEEKALFFKEILDLQDEHEGKQWLKSVMQTKSSGYQLLMKQYQENKEMLRQNLTTILSAIQMLTEQEEKQMIPVFAAKTTGNPHFFDTGTFGEQILTLFLKEYLSAYVDEIDDFSTKLEKKTALYYKAGLLKDDLSNHTLVYGLKAFTKDGMEHLGINGFCDRGEPLHLTLFVLGILSQIMPQHGERLYVVENPAVFSTWMQKNPKDALVCGNGQLRLATLALLDLLPERVRIYYSGDFDPEGLLIAQHLKERYGERVYLYGYEKSVYRKYQSQEELSEVRLKKLQQIYLSELQEIKAVMLEDKRATYQEAMMSSMIP